ncbi:hypothetical protein PACTADRAFT_51757 [Pachysolen tannophilus NRRL Y-2460]|uniref:NADPH-dependent 1-acyldihydroxyacetone phosphate reductase n=1 Tax=Pachysolen tannophilus NRRL Y-2460 TaxID=669874 RepID=A0A1E4TMZ8_PACTA|nr:hypothetical protein PACTADRAFT_51757 [Pachysolen tannophilus NRRL Y-2460]
MVAVEKRYALVTGASSGIGKDLSIELASRGIQVYACARRMDRLADLEQYGIEIIQLDVTNAQEVSRVRELIASKTNGKLDILFNNAGIGCTSPAIEIANKDMRSCFEVNFFAAVNMTKEFSPLLINSKGCVAFTGSVAADVPLPWGSIYGASKAALKHYCKILTLEMRPFDVRVLHFSTGAVDTEIFEKFQSLPESSRYYCDATNNSLQILGDQKRMDSKKYAAKVVNDILNGTGSGQIYRGAGATTAYFLGLLPMPILNFVVTKVFKFDEVCKALKEKAKARFVE